MRVLYLTINRKLFGTTRILLDWITLGRGCGIEGCVGVVAEDDLAKWCRHESVPCRVGPQPLPAWRRPLASPWHAWQVARFARRQGVRLIHCNEHNCHPFALQVQRFLNVPIVCHVRYKLERAWVEWTFSGKQRPAAVLWTSRQQKQDCLEATRGLVPEECQHIVNLGLDLQRFGAQVDSRAAVRHKWGFADHDLIIGYATVLQPRKRLFDFVDAVAELAKRDARVAGVLAGHVYPDQEPYRDQVLRHIESKGMGKRFLWLGRVDPIEPFDHAIDICLHTSEYETFGMSVCEAMACRKPVVAYEAGSVREVVADAGLIVPNGDLPALIEKTWELVRDERLRQELGERGRRRVADNFSPARAVQQLKGIYDSVLANA